MTLVIIAAGMGSRYGGLKQIDPITAHGEFIIDFSVYDAIRTGFEKVIFVIKEENFDVFRETVGKRIEGKIDVEYAFQKLEDIPDGFSVPDGRTKPWGTAHALLAARKMIDCPFVVINADDFYGREAFRLISEHLRETDIETSMNRDKIQTCCMAGYKLKNTLTENGSVSRGICVADDDSYLVSVTERTKIMRKDSRVVYIDDNGEACGLSEDSIASMNFWGLTPALLDYMWQDFTRFLSGLDMNNPASLKREFYLPYAVADAVRDKKCSVKVYPVDAIWYGVTYHEDKEPVKKSIGKLIAAGEYPDGLWKNS